MSNLDTIRYKATAHPDWVKKIHLIEKNGVLVDGDSQDINIKKSPLRLEYEKWLAIPGNELEPEFTAQEIEAKNLQDKKDALLEQEKMLLDLIIKNQYHLTTKRKAFIPDIPTWESKLDKWDDQLDLVRDQIELMNQGEDFVLIDIEPEPTF